ncbi:cysteine hydrolase family protein [Inquilinus sp. NPDC058860]|uniref:cysteine hydrolase family protein n=1 Tax=Inquilinus sp. NPDC058860 TaxID=3346652 RepID=UPI0036A50977
MAEKKPRDMIVGRPVLLVVDIQKGSFMPRRPDSMLEHMPDSETRCRRARTVVDAARAAGVPIVFIQEIHRSDRIDYGRELDGSEGIHCLDGDPSTPLAVEEMGILPTDYTVPKRRYSAFYGTDLEILLKALKAETLILVGGFTDVCVHYTFVDGHQGDYFCRVVEDCVAGSSIAAHDAALRAMEYLQSGARRSSAEIIAAFALRQAA